MSECLFCRIVRGEVPATIVHEAETLVAFEDISPRAPTHILIVPRRHVATINDLAPSDKSLVGEMIWRSAAIAKERGIANSGYRTVFNCNRGAGQTVFHIHLHLLGGRPLAWPPG